MNIFTASTLPIRIQPYLPWLTRLDKHFNIHPMLASFTTALLTISLITDIGGRFKKHEHMRITAAWTMLFAGIITPITGLMGWFFWGPGDDKPKYNYNMTIHMWLGTSLVVVYILLAIWRWRIYRRNNQPSNVYLAILFVVFAAVLLQAKLGGDTSFPPPKNWSMHLGPPLHAANVKHPVAATVHRAAAPHRKRSTHGGGAGQ